MNIVHLPEGEPFTTYTTTSVDYSPIACLHKAHQPLSENQECTFL